jgi:hypothetical protein
MSAYTREIRRRLLASGDPLTLGILHLLDDFDAEHIIERVKEIDGEMRRQEPQKRGKKSIWVDELGRQNGLVLYAWLQIEVIWRLHKPKLSKSKAMNWHFKKLAKQGKRFSVGLPGGDHYINTAKAACDLHADGERQFRSMRPSRVEWWRRKAVEAVEAGGV